MANSQSNTRLRRNASFIVPLIAFAIPVIVRAIPEVLMGQYLVGFDTIGYYVPTTLNWLNNGVAFWDFISSSPLIYMLLMGIASSGISIVYTLKVFAPLLLGFLSVAIYFYAHKALAWSPKKSLVVALFSTLYFVTLRISWDMFRCELALVFLFLALILLQKDKQTLKTGVLLAVSLALVSFTHQLVAVIMLVAVVATVTSLSLKNKSESLKTSFCCLPAAVLFLFIVYINYFVNSSPIAGYSRNFSAGFSSLASYTQVGLIFDTLGFLVFCFLPMVPLLFFGARFRSNIQLKAWIVWCSIPLLLTIVIPNAFFLGGVLPYRWTLLLVFPLSFYAVHGLSKVRWKTYKIAVCLALAIFSVSFMVLPNSDAINYYGAFPTYIPKSMLQNTVQLSDCQDTANTLQWVHNNMPTNGILLTHSAFYGWATLQVNNSQLIPYFFDNPADAANQTHQTKPTNPLYLVWWVNGTGWYGQPTLPSSFQMLYHSGNIAVYKYLPI